MISKVPSGAMNNLWYTADWWFQALDQRSVAVGAQRWTMQVVGIHRDGANLWIQLESMDSVCRMVLQVLAGMSLHEALATITAILSRGATASA